MKRLLIGDSREDLLSALEIIFRHWGYRVSASSRSALLEGFLRESSPSLLILGAGLLAAAPASLREAVRKAVGGGIPLIILQEADAPRPGDLPHEVLEVPLDLSALFAAAQRHLEKHPRRNLRLAVRLPGLICTGESSQLAEILSLSTHGLFIRSAARLTTGDPLRVVFPLMGMKKELELDGEVLYRIEPTAGNGYVQGIAVGFTALGEETRRVLRAFLESRLIGSVVAGNGHADLSPEQLREDDRTVILRLSRP
jgi:Tfp pilus assembly protein PilZ